MSNPRILEKGRPGDPDLGPLSKLPGVWGSVDQGWNMIALPFAEGINKVYRLLLNQYKETLEFTLVDKNVANRGVKGESPRIQHDEFVAALDYEQTIEQVAAEDRPDSGGQAGQPGLAIHHEPGLWLYMRENPGNDAFNIARLGTIPHGNTVLALGKSAESNGAIQIPEINGIPFTFNTNTKSKKLATDGYIEPYQHYHDHPFKGNVTCNKFPGFDPIHPHKLLQKAADDMDIASTTILNVSTDKNNISTDKDTVSIPSIPFAKPHANPISMQSTFWIHTLQNGELVLQYAQVVNIDFLGDIWPHVSINTLKKCRS